MMQNMPAQPLRGRVLDDRAAVWVGGDHGREVCVPGAKGQGGAGA